MTIPLKNPSEQVLKLLYEKQVEFKVEKKHVVSLSYTIERLLKDAYLKENSRQENREGKKI